MFKTIKYLFRGIKMLLICIGTITVLLVFIGVIAMLSDRRLYYKYHYEEKKIDVFNGTLTVTLRASHVSTIKDNKKIAIESNPYRFLFEFNSEKEFDHIELHNVSLIGNTSGKQMDFPVKTSNKAWKFTKESKTFIAIVGFSEYLENKKLQFEPFTITGTLILYKDTTNKEKKQFKLILKTNYSEEKKSVIFSRIMSI